MAKTTANNSFSYVEYLSSAPLNTLDAYAITCSFPNFPWHNIALTAKSLASVIIINGLLKSGAINTGSLHSASFNFSKDFCWSAPQLNSESFLSKSKSGFAL